jgi:anti-sigma factor RsiW
MNHFPVNQLLAVYVLGACEQAETLVVEAHLSQCPACAADARPFQAAADWLGVALATRPPAALRARVLRQAQARPWPSTGLQEMAQERENALIQRAGRPLSG